MVIYGGINMGIKHYKGENYLIEQYTPNTACILIQKPFVEDFIIKDFETKIKAVLKPILEESETLDNNILIYVDMSTKLAKERKHNDIKIQIYFKFNKALKFKEKVKELESVIIPYII